VARPLFLDIESSPVSDGIKRIVNFINNTPKCTRKKLLEALAPTPKLEAKPVAETPAPVTEGETAVNPAETKLPELLSSEPTSEQTLVLVDLHWLIHAGAVLEFADGRMETAKKPAPKPPKAEKRADAEKPTASEPVASTDIVTPAEIAESTETVAPLPETAAETAPAPEPPPAA
jgi:hypothetical protein